MVNGEIIFAVPGDLATPTGGYAYDRRMIAELSRLGWHVHVLDLGDGFPRPSQERRVAAAARLAALPTGWPIVIDGLAFGVLPNLAMELRARHPLIALVHHPLALETGLSAGEAAAMRLSERAALAAAHQVIVTSPATARLLAADYAVARERIVIVPPGADRPELARASDDGQVRLLSVGSIVPRKGFDILMAALGQLKDLSWRLAIAGDRTRDVDAAARLDADIIRFGLKDRITVLGALSAEQVAALYRSADLFVLASRFEGYGMAFAEAIAYGLPVIGTTAGAIPETVPPGAGLLVPPEDVDALAAALRRLIENRNERESLAHAARMAAARLPTWEQSARLFSHALEAIL